LTDEVRKWAADAKRRGLIKCVGFSTHKNIAQTLSAAARLDWVDAVLTGYNFQLMQDPELQAAIDACYEAGIGLIAIKTQRKTSMDEMNIETEEDRKLTDHFTQRGYTDGQAKLKVVLEDKRISAAAVGMRELDILATNVAAAVDQTKLTREDRTALKDYARATCNRYCTGCAHICDAALPDAPYVSDIMRYLMYHNSYGDHNRARTLFARIPRDVRTRLLDTDYTRAEARCPQRLPIAGIVAEAVSKLA
jgi:predicted aldo/keto reductase-like oxidoreductase